MLGIKFSNHLHCILHSRERKLGREGSTLGQLRLPLNPLPSNSPVNPSAEATTPHPSLLIKRGQISLHHGSESAQLLEHGAFYSLKIKHSLCHNPNCILDTPTLGQQYHFLESNPRYPRPVPSACPKHTPTPHSQTRSPALTSLPLKLSPFDIWANIQFAIPLEITLTPESGQPPNDSM